MRLALYLILVCGLPSKAWSQLGPPAVPAANPITEEKRILGKLLFWEEQLSSDNTMACGTCHKFEMGGSDERPARHAGRDNEYQTYDDVFGSRGIRLSNSNGDFVAGDSGRSQHALIRRTANSVVMAAYHAELMWDGRASTSFEDPETGELLIESGGALESQAVLPILSSDEMAYPDRTWGDVREKLITARPMALVTDLPADMESAISGGSTYPELFEAAFGDPEITGARIAFAIATYERTLVPDQTPWDLFKAGQTDALTPSQENGRQLFSGVARCNLCHTPPEFSDDRFHNIGIRPKLDDQGRFKVTLDIEDMGLFKDPSLRNVGLRPRLFHTGRMPEFHDSPEPIGESLVQQAMTLYIRGGGPHQNNLSSQMVPLNITDDEAREIADFVEHALIDTRMRDGLFPFDSPTLFSQGRDRGVRFSGVGVPGRRGEIPQAIIDVPPLIGGGPFRFGVEAAHANSIGWVEVEEVSSNQNLFGGSSHGSQGSTIISSGIIHVEGSSTWQVELAEDPALIGRVFNMRWCIFDQEAIGRVAQTRQVQVTVH
jgi:cytochrome c peroxidase